jgi:hypothetical protein
MHGGAHETVDEHGAGVFIDLIFYRVTMSRYFDNYIDFVRQVIA